MLRQGTMPSTSGRPGGTATPSASAAAHSVARMLRNPPVHCRRALSLRLRAAKEDRKLEERQAGQWGKGVQQLQQQQPAAGRLRQEQAAANKGWRLLDWQAYNQPWDVPWGGGTLAGGMAAWVAGFGIVAFLVMPSLWARATGRSLLDLGPDEQAQFALASEVLEAAATALVLLAATSKHRGELAARQLFVIDPSAPLARGTGWLAWGLIGLAAAPAVVGATAALAAAAGWDAATSGSHGTADAVAGMITMSGPTYGRLLAVTSLLAPALEECVFRGFLLTGLTARLPVWAAVVASSAAFAAAHLSPRDAPVLFTLGCLLGFLYVRSRNLLTPMLVHGAWNGGVLTALFLLAGAGVDVERLVREGTGGL